MGLSVPTWLVTFTWSIVGLASLGTIMGWFAHRGWLFDLASHFRWQYAWLLGASTVVLLAQQWPGAIAAGGMMCLNLRAILPTRAAVSSTAQSRQRTTRALLLNVLWTNRSHERVKRFIRETKPDFGVLVEISTEWIAALRELETAYAFTKVVMHTEHFGLFFFSRVPVERLKVIRLGATSLPSIWASVRIDETPLTVIATHPHSPKSPLRTRWRNQQLGALAEFVREHPPTPLMVLGDLNTTPWNPAFQQLIRKTRLRDSRNGFGNQPTWPVLVPLLGIPIDHCLVSPEIIVTKRSVGPSVGSDHYPVIIDFSIG